MIVVRERGEVRGKNVGTREYYIEHRIEIRFQFVLRTHRDATGLRIFRNVIVDIEQFGIVT